MGMYTGLRFKGIIKEDYCNMINDLMSDDNEYDWHELADKYEQFGFIKEFIDLPRCNTIPFGSLAYMPDEWEELIDVSKGKKYDNYKDIEGWERNYNYETGYLQFQCSLKNYNSEIEFFLNRIITIIAESTDYIETYYEEDRYGYLYDLIDGKIVEIDDNKIDYEPWRTDDNQFWY